MIQDFLEYMYGGADKSLARPGRKQATATEDFDILYKEPTRCNFGSIVY